MTQLDILDKYLESIYYDTTLKNKIEIRNLQRYINTIEKKARAYDSIKDQYLDMHPDHRLDYIK